MDIFNANFAAQLISTVIYGSVGFILFLVAFWVITKISPFSIRKEIEDDQNTSLAILIGSALIGMAIIIAAVIVSP